MADSKPQSLFGWLGRQVGFVRKAIQTDVTAPPPRPAPSPAPPPPPSVLYRNDKIEEAPHPADPSLVMRRTTIDEVMNKESGQ